MAENPVDHQIQHAREMIRGNVDRITRSATRLDHARQRLVESVERLQSPDDLKVDMIHDEAPGT